MAKDVTPGACSLRVLALKWRAGGNPVLSQCSLARKILTSGQRQPEGVNKSKFHLIISDREARVLSIIWLFGTQFIFYKGPGCGICVLPFEISGPTRR